MKAMYATRWMIPAAITLFSGLALGVEPGANPDANPDQAVKPATTDNAPILQGPSVEDAGRPDGGESDDMKGAEPADRDAPADGHAHERPRLRAYFMAVRSLGRAGDDLSLTEDQGAKLREIVQAHRAEIKAFMEENKEEIQHLRALAGERPGHRGADDRHGPGPGEATDLMGRPDENPGPTTDAPADPSTTTSPRVRPAPQSPLTPPTPEQAHAREQLRVLMAKAPSGEKALTELTALLTQAQRDHIKKALEEQRERPRHGDDGARGGRMVRPSARGRADRVEKQPESGAARRQGEPGGSEAPSGADD